MCGCFGGGKLWSKSRSEGDSGAENEKKKIKKTTKNDQKFKTQIQDRISSRDHEIKGFVFIQGALVALLFLFFPLAEGDWFRVFGEFPFGNWLSQYQGPDEGDKRQESGGRERDERNSRGKSGPQVRQERRGVRR